MEGMLGTVVDWIVRLIEPLYATAGYGIVAAGVLAERSILIGLIVPGDVILALGGLYAAEGRLSLTAVIVIGTLAAVCGESIGYWLGRRYGRGLLRRLPVVGRFEPRLDSAEDFFHRHGGKTVAIGRYATAAGAFVPFTAGIARMPYPRFLLFDVPAIVVWATGITVFGYVFGRNLDFVDKVLSRFGLLVLALVVLFVAWRVAVAMLRRRRSRP